MAGGAKAGGVHLLDDTELCDLVRSEPAGSASATAAFGELYERHRQAAMANAYRILGDRHAAEDAVSEAFAKSLSALRRGLGSRESFLGYLMTAVRTEALRASQMERNTSTTLTDQLPERATGAPRLVAEDHAARLSERDQLERAFCSLPEEWRRVLMLLEVEGASIKEAAERLGATPQAVNSMAGRAREGLRSAYLQQYVSVASSGCSGVAVQLARFVRAACFRDALRRCRATSRLARSAALRFRGSCASTNS